MSTKQWQESTLFIINYLSIYINVNGVYCENDLQKQYHFFNIR